MANICSTCGLPDELCVCEDVAKTMNEVRVHTEERRYNKVMTIVSGLDPKEVDLDDLSSELKSHLACGGTVNTEGDEHTIELQGEHTVRLAEKLDDLGYTIVDDGDD